MTFNDIQQLLQKGDADALAQALQNWFFTEEETSQEDSWSAGLSEQAEDLPVDAEVVCLHENASSFGDVLRTYEWSEPAIRQLESSLVAGRLTADAFVVTAVRSRTDQTTTFRICLGNLVVAELAGNGEHPDSWNFRLLHLAGLQNETTHIWVVYADQQIIGVFTDEQLMRQATANSGEYRTVSMPVNTLLS